jgi:hypothetical protein
MTVLDLQQLPSPEAQINPDDVNSSLSFFCGSNLSIVCG